MAELNHTSLYPAEYHIPLKPDEISKNASSFFLEGRIIINQGWRKHPEKNQREIPSYSCEINIVQKESGKIFKHIKSLFDYQDPQDLLSDSLRELKQYFFKE